MATRSLGSLTLDLLLKLGAFESGLDKAERQTKKSTSSMKKEFDGVKKSVIAFAAAAPAALTALTVSVVNSGREIQNLSKLANTSAEEFQRITYAAQRYGVEQDKVADILKDTSDKVGDFLQTGGGPLADFFENIAPSVGVTAEQFRNLSSDQALGLYVKSLQKANLSQNEMTFFLEAIASDATTLLPLFQNNAKELKNLGDQADRFGNVISDIELKQLQDVAQNIGDLKAAYKGLSTEVALSTIPAVKDLTDFLSDEQTLEAARALAGAIVSSFNAATKAIANTIGTVKFLGEELAATLNGVQADDIVRLEEQAEEIKALLDGGFFSKADRVRFFGKDGLVEYYDDNELQQKLTEIEGAIEAYYKNSNIEATVPVIPIQTPTLEELENNRKNKKERNDSKGAEIKQYLTDLETQIALLGKSADEQELYKLSLQGATEAQLKNAQAMLYQISAYEEEEEIQKTLLALRDEQIQKQYEEQEAINDKAQAIADSLRSEEEMIRDSYERRRDLILKNTEITGAAQNELLAKLAAQQEAQLLEIEERKNEKIREGYSSLLDVIGKFYDGMEGEQAAYARAAIAFGQALLDKEKQESLKKIVARTQSAAMGAYEALSSIPYVGPALGAAAAGVVIAAGATAAAKVTGIAHDGLMEVPQTGTYILEKGERVTTEKTSAKLDKTLDQVQQSSGANGGMSNGTNIRIVNAIETQFIGDYMGSADGEEVIMNVIRRNENTIRNIAAG